LLLLHGFGASGEDLVPIADEIAARDPGLADQLCCVFPGAPLAPPEFAQFGGRAWWPIDMERLQRAAQRGEVRDLRAERPELLPAAREHLERLVSELQQETGLGIERFVLGGFSQGSMLAVDVVLRMDAQPGGLIVWSGTLLNESEWRPLAPRRAGLPVVVSHGRQDPILPFANAEALRDVFQESGLQVRFVPFAGPHTIPAPGLAAAIELIAGVAANPQ
jgi:phospholipase/carboxylesterase